MTICTRCGGWLRLERLHWRRPTSLLACTACGDRVDGTILAHRREQAYRARRGEPVWEQIQTLVGQTQ
jgi:hypothetical protein